MQQGGGGDHYTSNCLHFAFMIQVGSRVDIITAAFIVWPRVAQLTRAPGAVTGHILTQPCAAVTSSPAKIFDGHKNISCPAVAMAFCTRWRAFRRNASCNVKARRGWRVLAGTQKRDT